MKNFGSVATQQLKVVGNELKETGIKIEETGTKLAGVSATATGEAVEETEKYKSIMQELYSANYGDSIEDVASKILKIFKIIVKY